MDDNNIDELNKIIVSLSYESYKLRENITKISKVLNTTLNCIEESDSWVSELTNKFKDLIIPTVFKFKINEYVKFNLDDLYVYNIGLVVSHFTCNNDNYYVIKTEIPDNPTFIIKKEDFVYYCSI